MDRRSFLRTAGVAGAGLAVLPSVLPGGRRVAADPTLAPFLHGVASGDPLTDRVILWTRVTTETPGPVNVHWRIARDPELHDTVAAGTVFTDAERDHTVKVDATGLVPGTTYYFGFSALGRHSLTGRTRTAPSGPVEHLRFGVVSCSHFATGFFNAYARLAERHDLDAIIHLGDYFYESGAAGSVGRPHDPPHETVSLADYRTRHAQYKLDPDLRRLHQQLPWVTVWDDHESANNAWFGGAQNHQPDEGNWVERKAAAIRAYREWMPIRLPDESDEQRIHRTVRFGDLVDLIMLDTRLAGREQQVGQAFMTVTEDDIDELDRTILGREQEVWLAEQLRTSTASWRFIGQQVMFGHLHAGGLPTIPDSDVPLVRDGGNAINPDQWDGYPANRQRIFDQLRTEDIANVVVLTGDIHTSWALDLPEDPYNPAAYKPASGEGSLAVEFVTPSVTSDNIDDATGVPSDGFEALVRVGNPHVKYVELDSNGYLLLDVTPERVQGEWYFVETVEQPSASESLAAAFQVRNGENRVVPAAEPAASRADAAAAPAEAPSAAEAEAAGVPLAAVPTGPAVALAAGTAALALRTRRHRPPSPRSSDHRGWSLDGGDGG